MDVPNKQLARVQTRIAKAHIALGQNFKGPHDNVTKLLSFGNLSRRLEKERPQKFELELPELSLLPRYKIIVSYVTDKDPFFQCSEGL